ncbi:MAG: NifU family protein [Chloroflexota bacterium]|nr:NifU family protein [Chloroflexota bacterium]
MASVSDESPLFLIPLEMVQQPPADDPEAEFAHLLAWVGEGVERMERIEDDRTRAEVFALLDGIDTMHRYALGRLMELGGAALVAQIGQDPLVRTLLEMYDLSAVDEREQVEHALQSVYPYIESHGGHLELLGVEAGAVRVRLSGSCGDCPGSSGTLARVVETALRDSFPGFRALVAEQPLPASPLTEPATQRALRRPRWVTVGRVADFMPGELRAVWPEGASLLLARLGDEFYAYQNGCPPGSPLTLHTGRLEGTTLICPWHGCRYDIRTGKRLDGAGKLEVLPVAVRDGEIKIAAGTEEVAAV